MLKWGKDPGDKDSWEGQGCWERMRTFGRDEVTEREGDSWQGIRLHGGDKDTTDGGASEGQGRLGDKDAWREEDMEEGQGFPGH